MWRQTCTNANSMHSAALLPHLYKDNNSAIGLCLASAAQTNIPDMLRNTTALINRLPWWNKCMQQSVMSPSAASGRAAR